MFYVLNYFIVDNCFGFITIIYHFCPIFVQSQGKRIPNDDQETFGTCNHDI